MKRGQGAISSGTGAASLIAVIGLLIVLYILFLPPESRQELLGENTTSSSGGSTTTATVTAFNRTLVSVNPGRIDYTAELEVDHNIPSVNLISRQSGNVLEEIDALRVTRSLFTEQVGNMTFMLKDTQNTENALLSFSAQKYQGALKIKLNGNLIYENEIKRSLVDPIPLPKKYLKSENNVEIIVSSPGVAFWSTNEYILENVKITADITDVSLLESKAVFLVDASEKDNLKKGILKFTPDCEVNKVGKLSVIINNNEVFLGLPDCGQVNTIEFIPYFTAGENKIVMRAEKGPYLIDHILVRSMLNKPREYVYDFQVSNDELSGMGDIRLRLEFTDETSYKEADIVVNGGIAKLSTNKRIDERTIKPFIVDGFNYVRIIPKSSMYIAKLQVMME